MKTARNKDTPAQITVEGGGVFVGSEGGFTEVALCGSCHKEICSELLKLGKIKKMPKPPEYVCAAF